jgi:8-oxo-dGTP pyrophosphatase MutT (NUDIX family)
VLLLRKRKAGAEERRTGFALTGGEHPGAPDLEVYMIRREESLRFLGGYYAFPGGQVDPEDYQLAREIRGARAGTGNPSIHGNDGPTGEEGTAHQVAAIRELYEEVGVLLSRPLAGNSDGLPGGGAPLDADRERLLAGRDRFFRVLERAGLRADLESLSFLDRWVTPEGLPIRYDTKFYTAWMPEGQQPDPYPGEASWGGWVRPQEVLHDADSGRMPMVFSTMACLAKLLEL